MKGQPSIFAKQKGMTLTEVLVTLGVLSVVLMSTLTLYSTSFKDLRTRDSLLNILHDADLIMSHIGNDIRHADEFLSEHHSSESQTVVAAMKMVEEPSKQGEERVIIYSLDAERPNRLVRSVYTGKNATLIELSTLIRKLEIIPTTDRLVEVKLTLEDKVAERVNTFQTSSAFALR